MEPPTTLAGVQLLIDTQVPESVHLDYKRSEALTKAKPDLIKAEVAKDVSAFANSDGGLLIYGVVEEDQLPKGVDEGVDDAKWSGERFESVINFGITPRIDGIEIHPIPVSTGRFLYVISIPRSRRAPHQELSGFRYYRRYGTQSVPMEDYEIRDVRNRFTELSHLVAVDVDVRGGVWLELLVRNVGDALARDISFQLSPDVPAVTKEMTPNWVTNGLRFLYPTKEYRMTLGTVHEALVDNPKYPAQFDVGVTYTDTRTASSLVETFHFDVSALKNTPLIHSQARELGDTLKEALEKLTKEVAAFRGALEELKSLAGGSGLDLSVTTLRNLQRILRGETEFERLDPAACAPEAFCEILGVPYAVAHTLSRFFRYRRHYAGKVEDVQGMTPELVNALKRNFRVSEEGEGD